MVFVSLHLVVVLVLLTRLCRQVLHKYVAQYIVACYEHMSTGYKIKHVLIDIKLYTYKTSNFRTTVAENNIVNDHVL